MFGRKTVWRSYFIVFVASCCGLIIELVAGRMMAPFIGVSLYTWTSIIGVVLAGISIGNYLGGKIADRAARPQTLGVLFLLSGLASLAIIPLVDFMGTKTGSMPIPLMARIAFLTAVIFFLPSCLLGTISPVVVKLTLKDLKGVGTAVGKIYAWSTVGSIVGTFATGFVLISWFGTRTIVGGVATVCVIMAVVYGELWKRQRTITAVLLLVFVSFGYYLDTQRSFVSPYWKESNYYSIRFQDIGEGDNAVRQLVLDHLVHSYVSKSDPTHLEYSYEKVYADIVEYLSQTRPSLNTVFIGGGGYTFPRYMEHIYPTSNLDVIEIDPEVTRAVYEELWLPRDSRIATYNMDGRLFFSDVAEKGKYDLVMGDAFNDLSVPYHLTTLEFTQKLKESMKPNGFLLVNIIDNPSRGAFLRPYVNTLKQVFPHVTVAAVGEGWTAASQNTLIIVASNEALDPSTFSSTIARLHGGKETYTKVMPEATLAEYMKQGTNLVLTDEHAPVDQLMAVLFDERGY